MNVSFNKLLKIAQMGIRKIFLCPPSSEYFFSSLFYDKSVTGVLLCWRQILSIRHPYCYVLKACEEFALMTTNLRLAISFDSVVQKQNSMQKKLLKIFLIPLLLPVMWYYECFEICHIHRPCALFLHAKRYENCPQKIKSYNKIFL